MKKKVWAILTVLFFVIVTTSAFAQVPPPSDQATPPGPGYGMESGGGTGPYGPGNRYGMGPDSRGGYGMGPGMMGSEYGYGMGPWMFVFMLIFLLLVIAGVVLLVRYLSPHARSKPSEGALEVLKRRYARGEIQKAEFEEKRKDLES